jgi:hypothetical protein
VSTAAPIAGIAAQPALKGPLIALRLRLDKKVSDANLHDPAVSDRRDSISAK